MYSDEHATDFRSTRYPKRLSDEFGPVKAAERKIESALHIKRSYTARKSIDRTEEGLERTDEEASVVDHVRINVEPVTRENDEDELEQPELTLPWTLGMLVIVTSVSLYFNAFCEIEYVLSKCIDNDRSKRLMHGSSSTALMVLQRRALSVKNGSV